MDVRVPLPVEAFDGRPQVTGDPDGSDRRAEELRALFRSTPAKLVALGLVLAVLVVVSGALSAQVVSSRKSTHDTLLATTEPLADAAQKLYSALSVADAAAVTGFISGGIEPLDVRDRYIQAVGEASTQLVVAASGLPLEDRLRADHVTEIARMLPIYTGLIETARANNRTGNPVGAAYLTQASHLMQQSLLPVAQELHTQAVSAVESTQRASVRPPWVAIGLLLVTVAALGCVHLLISRRTHRTFNPGLLLALASMGLLLCWLLIAGLASSAATERAISQGAEPLATLTESRILAQQSRTAETLQLARRDATGTYDGVFAESMDRLGVLLDGYADGGRIEVGVDAVDRAVTAWEVWLAAHARMVAALDRGDYTAAAVLATGSGPDEATAQFAALDRALDDAIHETRAELRDNETRASRTLSGLAPTSVVLMFVALLGVVVGLWPRLREYQ